MEITKVVKLFIRRGRPNTFGNRVYIKDNDQILNLPAHLHKLFVMPDQTKYILHFKINQLHFKEINIFIQQGCIQLIKSDNKGSYNFEKVLHFK